MKKWLPRLGLIAVIFGCTATPTVPAARLRGPLDSVVAGTSDQYMYVAGGVFDALYIMDLTSGATMDVIGAFVRGPNKFFPLEIPAGANPIALARTGDGAFVISLAASDHSLYLVNADQQLVVRNADGDKERIDVGASAAAIVRAPNQVGPGERYYVSNVIEQSVRIVDVVRDGDGNPSFVSGGSFAHTGSIARMIINDDGTALFGSDLSSHFVHRVNTIDGTTADFDVSGYASDIAIGGAGAILFVARPDTLSVDMYNPVSGVKIAASATVTPLLPDDEVFDTLYIGDIPARLKSIEFTSGGLVAYCDNPDNAQETQAGEVNSVVFVASDSGAVYFIDAAQQKIIDVSFCFPPAVTNPDNPDLWTDSPFQKCDQGKLPERLTCIETLDGDNTGVIVANGNVDITDYRLIWEGVIAGLDRSTGGGTLINNGEALVDQGTDLSLFDVRVGDQLLLENSPLPVDNCQETYGAEGSRRFRISSIDASGGFSRALHFDPPINPSCFSGIAAALDYQVRPNQAYTMYRQVTSSGAIESLPRLGLGETFGASGDPVRFTLRTDLMPAPDDQIHFAVRAIYAKMTGGRAVINDGVTNPFLAVGRVPTSISFARVGSLTGDARFFVSFVTFAATDSIIYFDPRSSHNTETQSIVGTASTTQGTFVIR